MKNAKPRLSSRPGPKIGKLSEEYLRHRNDQMRTKNLAAQMLLAERRGQLIERRLVERQAAFLLLSLRQRILTVPDRLARQLVNIADVKQIKFDGYRCIAVKRRQEVTLFSLHKKVLNKRFPGVVEALASLDGDFVLDGELVALDSQGRPSFQVLQNNLSRSLPVYLYCFDLLNLDGKLL